MTGCPVGRTRISAHVRGIDSAAGYGKRHGKRHMERGETLIHVGKEILCESLCWTSSSEVRANTTLSVVITFV